MPSKNSVESLVDPSLTYSFLRREFPRHGEGKSATERRISDWYGGKGRTKRVAFTIGRKGMKQNKVAQKKVASPRVSSRDSVMSLVNSSAVPESKRLTYSFLRREFGDKRKNTEKLIAQYKAFRPRSAAPVTRSTDSFGRVDKRPQAVYVPPYRRNTRLSRSASTPRTTRAPSPPRTLTPAELADRFLKRLPPPSPPPRFMKTLTPPRGRMHRRRKRRRRQ
jgi:hypothetical protein